MKQYYQLSHYLNEVLWSDTGKVEAESGVKETEKNCRENDRSQKRHGVRDRDLEARSNGSSTVVELWEVNYTVEVVSVSPPDWEEFGWLIFSGCKLVQLLLSSVYIPSFHVSASGWFFFDKTGWFVETRFLFFFNIFYWYKVKIGTN